MAQGTATISPFWPVAIIQSTRSVQKPRASNLFCRFVLLQMLLDRSSDRSFQHKKVAMILGFEESLLSNNVLMEELGNKGDVVFFLTDTRRIFLKMCRITASRRKATYLRTFGLPDLVVVLSARDSKLIIVHYLN